MKPTALQEEAFLNFLEGNKALIVKIAGIYCYNHIDRQDLIQDIILQLWKAFPTFDKVHASTTWTYRIALNVSISHLRKATTRKKTQNEYGQYAGLLQWNEHVVDERLEQLYNYINFLKPVEKAIIILHLDGVKNKEIAEIVGISATNTSTRLDRIKEKISNHLKSIK
ncbi:MAG: RNA polymerase sigma factor [Agriterribacter sp.]